MATTPDDLTANNDATGPSAADIDINPTGAKARAAFAETHPSVEAEENPTGSKARAAFAAAREQVSGVTGQATDKARDYAALGKDKAAEGLDSVTRLFDDAATTIDDKVGAQYGDYARKAASAISGVATSLRGKDVDQLLEDARGVVRKSPALAVGAAVAVGFVLARLVRAGNDGGDKSA
ncbi:hypothetical protein ACFB49_20680 [Sphingomonas sp. DBB INV C78]|uniref:hypothetical protein n=1 Tax=Sphingomonas sp. DBB INV C78 TaxID=3349434 RepID=UPI0036D37970